MSKTIPTILFLMISYLMRIEVNALTVPILANLIGSVIVTIIIIYFSKGKLDDVIKNI